MFITKLTNQTAGDGTLNMATLSRLFHLYVLQNKLLILEKYSRKRVQFSLLSGICNGMK
jgi:hypothetical protein